MARHDMTYLHISSPGTSTRPIQKYAFIISDSDMENDHKESVTESATGEAANDDSQNVSENEKAMVEEPKKDEHPIFKFIEEENLDAVQKQIDVEGVSIETEDSHGMTPLMHASWKGRTDIVEFLLKQGASPNGGNHEHDYTCLHFAGLAGSTEICR